MPPLTNRQLDRVAKAIYLANHQGPEDLPNNRTAPIWEAASDSVKDWCRNQAEAAVRTVEMIHQYPLTF